VHDFVCLLGDATIISGEQVDNYSSDSSVIDIIIGGGGFTNGSKVADQLLHANAPLYLSGSVLDTVGSGTFVGPVSGQTSQ